MIRLLIARHGNTFDKGDTILRVGLRTDLDLSTNGCEQALRLGNYIGRHYPELSDIYVSELKRTQQTATLALEHAKIRSIPKILPLLNEIDYGVDDGKPEEEVLARIGQEALNDWNTNAVLPPGWLFDKNQAIKDIKLFAQNLIQTAGAKTVLLVTSNGIARFFPTLLADAPEFYKKESLKLKTGSLSSFLFKNNQFQCEFWGRKP